MNHARVAAQSLATSSRVTKTPQILLILVGFPGSGKSTLADALVRTPVSGERGLARKWIRACQDETQSRRRQECEGIVFDALNRGENVIVDRMNFDPQQRSHFLRIGASHDPRPQTWCIVLDIAYRTLHDRLATRTSHPTIPDQEAGLRVIDQMKNQFRPPQYDLAEGFDRILFLEERDQPEDAIWTPEKLEALLRKVEDMGHRETARMRYRPPERGPRPARGGNDRGGTWRGR